MIAEEVEKRTLPSPPPSSDTGETTLVCQAQTGDRSAFDRLVAAFAVPLRGFIGRRVSPCSVEDVAQETFIAAWTGLPRYAPRRESTFAMWLYRIARNKTADWARGNARKAAHETAITPVDEERIAAPSPGLSVEQSAEIETLLQTLTPEQRTILELHYGLGLTLAQIAVQERKNVSTVKYHFYRAQAAMQAARNAGKEAK
ncbi:MAG: RNA polymerase sigma factor [Armatimonadetes bacterium]|nr:RNA polymerase sigma factor [Armatimonadota bacterium]